MKNYKSFKGILTDHLSSLPACKDQSIIPEELFSLAQTNWNNYSNKTGKGLDYYKNRVKSDMEEWVKKR